MAGHLLGVLEPSVVFQVNWDSGCPPGVTSDSGKKTRRLCPFSNRGPCVLIRFYRKLADSKVAQRPGGSWRFKK